MRLRLAGLLFGGHCAATVRIGKADLGPCRGPCPRSSRSGGVSWSESASLEERSAALACLIAVAVCAFTAAGNDRFTAVGQWIRRASQADLARLRAPWDPITGRYRVPDEKTIRVVLDRLDSRALARALLGPRRRRRPGGAPAGLWGFRTRQPVLTLVSMRRARIR